MNDERDDQEVVVKVLRSALDPKKPGFDDMVSIGTQMLVVLKELWPDTKCDVDLHDGSLHDFTVKYPHGEFLVHKRYDEEEKQLYWGLSMIVHCPTCDKDHEVASPVLSTSLLETLVGGLTLSLGVMLSSVFNIEASGEALH